MNDLKYNLVTKTGSIQFPHDLTGRLLELEIKKATEDFVYHIELRGWTLFRGIKRNPVWMHDREGNLKPYHAIDWTGEFTSTKEYQKEWEKNKDHRFDDLVRGSQLGPPPKRREMTLEDTDGMVEYRCVGVFWAPEVAIDILGNKYVRKQQEKAARNPTIFGPSGTKIT